MKAFHIQHSTPSYVDLALMEFMRSHANLVLALVTLGLSAWEMIDGHPLALFALMVIGAVGYFFGLFFALCVALPVVTMYPWVDGSVAHALIPNLLVQMVSDINIAWLGFRHRMLKATRPAQRAKHPEQMLPWAVINEVRTSLAAMRFLLFPLAPSDDLAEVSNELSRLENLFQTMERSDEERTSR